MAQKKVKVYALSTCIHCKNAKKYLDDMGVEYECVHVDQLSGDERKAVVEEVRRYNPATSFPTVVIDDECVVVGFKKDELDKILR
jgi:glutaredoxin